MKRRLCRILEQRKEHVASICENAQSILKDCGPILLFGYSSIVIEALKEASDEIKENTPIYILECKNKNQLNYRNQLLYCDGLRYALDLSDIGYKNVNLAPDSIAANLISKHIMKIFFGANTVDGENKIIGHTAGHSTIVNTAKVYNVPIYIFVDTYKFGPLSDDSREERDIDWFTGDKQTMRDLKNRGVKYYNPRSDILPLDCVYQFVTDVGNFPPFSLAKKLRNKINDISRTRRST